MRELETKFGAPPPVEVVKANQLRRTSTIALNRTSLIGPGGAGGALKRTSTVIGSSGGPGVTGIYHSTPLRVATSGGRSARGDGATSPVGQFSATHIQAQKSRAEQERVMKELKDKATSPRTSLAATSAASAAASAAASTSSNPAADEKSAQWAEREQMAKAAAGTTATGDEKHGTSDQTTNATAVGTVTAAGISIAPAAKTGSGRGRSRNPQSRDGEKRRPKRSHAATRRALYRSIPKSVRRNNHPIPPHEPLLSLGVILRRRHRVVDPSASSSVFSPALSARRVAGDRNGDDSGDEDGAEDGRAWFYDPRKHKSAKCHLVLGMDEVQVRRAKALMVLGVPDFDYEMAFEKELATLGYGNGPMARVAIPQPILSPKAVRTTSAAPAKSDAASRYALTATATAGTPTSEAARSRARDRAREQMRSSLLLAATGTGGAIGSSTGGAAMIVSPFGATPIDPRLRTNHRKSLIGHSPLLRTPNSMKPQSSPGPAANLTLSSTDLIAAPARPAPIVESPPAAIAAAPAPAPAPSGAPTSGGSGEKKSNIFTFNVPVTQTAPGQTAPPVVALQPVVSPPQQPVRTASPAPASAPAPPASSTLSVAPSDGSGFSTPAPALNAASRTRASPLAPVGSRPTPLGANNKLPALSPRTNGTGTSLSPRQPLPPLSSSLNGNNSLYRAKSSGTPPVLAPAATGAGTPLFGPSATVLSSGSGSGSSLGPSPSTTSSWGVATTTTTAIGSATAPLSSYTSGTGTGTGTTSSGTGAVRLTKPASVGAIASGDAAVLFGAANDD